MPARMTCCALSPISAEVEATTIQLKRAGLYPYWWTGFATEPPDQERQAVPHRNEVRGCSIERGCLQGFRDVVQELDDRLKFDVVILVQQALHPNTVDGITVVDRLCRVE